MSRNHIDLICPYCGELVLQLPTEARPIQERQYICTSCNRKTKIAKLMTSNGNTFQDYTRQNSPNAQIVDLH
ncbi:hypothetical protein GCM10011396_26550 [Undibacterium terreum]|uniref:Uncharacterized protein n=1 Tax=Undibacterium terreum TaxID=1224302 RepID=A0A916ULV8_9BURK|nr:hypothetical protein GCM10011396_26550 [Undibacterium terreum]